MPLTGALQADFSDFVGEANKASAALGVMEAEAKKTGQTLAKTGAIVDGVGTSASKLTQLSTGLRTVDQSANALGFSLAKPIGLIDELAQVAGKTTAGLGAMGTAGAVLGAAMSGWQVGRWIADLTGSDEIIGRLTANLLGMGDEAEIAANRAEVLAKASATAGRTITDMTEAITINYDAVKRGTAAVDTAIHRQALWEKEIRAHRDVLPEITAALANHTATIAQLEKQYGMSAAAITFYVAKTKDQTAAQDEATRKAEAAAAAQQKLRDAMFGTDSITQAQQYQAALGSTANLTRMTHEEQTKLNTVLGEAIASYQRAGEVAPQAMRDLYNATVSIGPVVTGLGAEFANIGTKVDMSVDHILTKIAEADTSMQEFEAETQRQVQAYIDMQYGAKAAATGIDATTTATERLSVALHDMGNRAMTAWESMKAGEALLQGYRNAGIFVGMQGGALSGYQQGQRLNAGREITGAGQAWGNTLNVNVNSTEAGDVANKLVGEMKRQGVRF